MKRHCQRCRVVHFMDLDPISFAYPDAVINLQSPGFYCAKCDKHLARKSNFLCHLEKTHSLKQPKFPYPNANIDAFESNFYYAVRDKHLSSKYAYELHLECAYNLETRPAKKLDIQ